MLLKERIKLLLITKNISWLHSHNKRRRTVKRIVYNVYIVSIQQNPYLLSVGLSADVSDYFIIVLICPQPDVLYISSREEKVHG